MFDAKSLLNMVLGAGQQATSSGQGGIGGAAGGLAGMVGSVLSQAAQGLQQGGRDLNRASGGVGDELQKMASQATGGRTTGDLMAQAKDLIAKNPGLAAAAAVGLGGVILGTRSGRGLATGAAKLGGLALIGGLAYSAWQNYQNGRPPMNQPAQISAAPDGSGFAEGDGEADNSRALLMVRAMIAAAASDGRIDDQERARIRVNLEQAGLDDEAARFLDDEFANPKDAAVLIRMATTPELAAQIYTAARLAIDPDTTSETRFLAELATGLRLDRELVGHIDAAAAAVIDNRAV